MSPRIVRIRHRVLSVRRRPNRDAATIENLVKAFIPWIIMAVTTPHLTIRA